MPGFLYFAEGDKPLTDMGQVHNLGLSHAFDSLPQCTMLDRGTPSGKPGFILSDATTLGSYQPRFFPDQQTWRKFGDVWIGFYNDAKPTPDDLRRTQMLPGVELELCDGNKWTVPVVYIYEGNGLQPNLPRFLDLDETGRCVPGPVMDQYRDLAQCVENFWDAWETAYQTALQNDNQQFVVSFDTVNEDAARVLAANYHVSLREIVALHLFQIGQTAGDVLRVACDCDTAALFLSYAYQQKKSEQDSDTSDIAAGHAA